jgi:hypothetical protein
MPRHLPRATDLVFGSPEGSIAASARSPGQSVPRMPEVDSMTGRIFLSSAS